MPFPPRATAGEDDGSDKVPPAELHRVSFTFSFTGGNQEREQGQGQGQRYAPHPADRVLQGWVSAGQEGSARRLR